mgnify:CR=1 FL=1
MFGERSRAFLQGFEGIGIGCVDLKRGTPRHYHLPTDTVENVDFSELITSVDFIELLIREMARVRTAEL